MSKQTLKNKIELAKLLMKVFREKERQYSVIGTTDDKLGGPPYRMPWFVIDTSFAEPEVNWPGELLNKYNVPQLAYDYKTFLIERDILEVLETFEEKNNVETTN